MTRLTGMVAALWRYRGFVLASVRREFDVRYRASLLGGLWALVHPLAQILVYTLVLANVMRARLPGVETTYGYSIYLCAGILFWTLFAEIVTRSTSVFVDNANLLKKLSFPRVCLPAVVTLSALLNFSILLALVLGVLVVMQAWPGWPLLALVPLVALEAALAVGLGLLAGIANVFYRDIGQGLGVVLQFWFWLTPIVYPLAVVPEAMHPWIALNPLAPIARAFQQVLVWGQWPAWPTLLPAVLLAIAALVLGLRAVRRAGADIVDEL